MENGEAVMERLCTGRNVDDTEHSTIALHSIGLSTMSLIRNSISSRGST